MKALAGGILVLAVCAAPLAAQEQDPSLKRISVALEQPPALVLGLGDDLAPPTFGGFTLVQPQMRGEIVRLSIPIGAMVMWPFKTASAANRRRQEGNAKRKVAADLEWFKAQQPPKQ